MSLKFPPVVIFLFIAMLMALWAYVAPVGNFDFFGRLGFSYFFAFCGFLVGGIGVTQFWLNKTTINPKKLMNTNKLITTGIYSFSRNPMYLGLLLLLIAWGLFLQNAFNSLLAAGFVYLMNRLQIIPEEQFLKNKFGKEYTYYLKLTRRWF